MGKEEKEKKFLLSDLPCGEFLKEFQKERKWRLISRIAIPVMMVAMFLMMFVFSGQMFKGFQGPSGYEEQTIFKYRHNKYPDQKPIKVAVIQVKGIIQHKSTDLNFLGSSGALVEEIVDQLTEAKYDPQVKAIILEVSSPGGEITASDTLHHEIEEFKTSGKKVIVYMNGVATSGAYYISTPADMIIAHPTTITGSIGVILNYLNYEGLFEKLGLKTVVFKSGEKKDIGSPTRPTSDEEKEIMQGIVDGFYNKFLNVIIEGRTSALNSLKLKDFWQLGLSDGRIFTAKTAQDVGLIDDIFYFDETCDITVGLLKVPEKPVTVVRYRRVYPLRDLLGMALQKVGSGFKIDLKPNLGQEDTPRFMYLWIPKR